MPSDKKQKSGTTAPLLPVRSSTDDDVLFRTPRRSEERGSYDLESGGARAEERGSYDLESGARGEEKASAAPLPPPIFTDRRHLPATPRPHPSYHTDTYIQLPDAAGEDSSVTTSRATATASNMRFPVVADQHQQHHFRLHTGNTLHNLVTNHRYNRHNEESRFQARYPLLSPLSHNHSRRSLAGSIPSFLIALCFSGLIIEAWHTGLDNDHMNDGAPPSGGQSHADGVVAERGTALCYTSLAVMLIGVAGLLWHFIDKKTYMKGYTEWCAIANVPAFSAINQQQFFQDLKAHTQYLLRIYDGTSGLAYMISNLNTHIGAPETEPELELGIGHEPHTGGAGGDNTPPPAPPTTLTNTRAVRELRLQQADMENSALDVTSSAATEQERVDQGTAGIIRRGDIFIERMHRARNKLDQSAATASASSLPTDDEAPVIQTHAGPPDGCNYFAATWMLEIRRQMSHLGINTSINKRANFLKKLIDNHPEDDQNVLLAPLVYTFLLFHTTHSGQAQAAFDNEHRKDIETFLRLTPDHRTTVLKCLCQFQAEGSTVALINEFLEALPVAGLSSTIGELDRLAYGDCIDARIRQKAAPQPLDTSSNYVSMS